MSHTNIILNNGIKIILAPSNNTDIVSIGIFIKAGSRNDHLDYNGTAHFLEHMMFKGTKNRSASQLFNKLDSLGAEYNAVTTSEHTYYYVYGHTKDTIKLLDLILDIYINPHFLQNEITKERKIIIDEIGIRSDLYMNKIYSIMNKKIYNGTSLSKDTIGTIDSVKKITKNVLNNFRKSNYKPEKSVFVMTGNFKVKTVLQIVKPILEQITPSLTPYNSYKFEKKYIIDLMQKQSKQYVHVETDYNIKQIYAILAYPMYDLYNKYRYRIDLLSTLLSGGFSSRLSKHLRENNGISYYSSSLPLAYSDNGIFIIQFVVDPDELRNCIKLIFDILENIKVKQISKSELKKIININTNNFLFTLVKPIELLKFYGVRYLKNNGVNINSDIKNISSVSSLQILNMAKIIFNKNKSNLFLYGPINNY